jgi:hypothetical protein
MRPAAAYVPGCGSRATRAPDLDAACSSIRAGMRVPRHPAAHTLRPCAACTRWPARSSAQGIKPGWRTSTALCPPSRSTRPASSGYPNRRRARHVLQGDAGEHVIHQTVGNHVQIRTGAESGRSSSRKAARSGASATSQAATPRSCGATAGVFVARVTPQRIGHPGPSPGLNPADRQVVCAPVNRSAPGGRCGQHPQLTSGSRLYGAADQQERSRHRRWWSQVVAVAQGMAANVVAVRRPDGSQRPCNRGADQQVWCAPRGIIQRIQSDHLDDQADDQARRSVRRRSVA